MSVFKETHVVNGVVVEAVFVQEGEDYTEFLEGVDVEDQVLEDWLMHLEPADWLLRRGNRLFRMDDEFYSNFFGKV